MSFNMGTSSNPQQTALSEVILHLIEHKNKKQHEAEYEDKQKKIKYREVKIWSHSAGY